MLDDAARMPYAVMLICHAMMIRFTLRDMRAMMFFMLSRAMLIIARYSARRYARYMPLPLAYADKILRQRITSRYVTRHYHNGNNISSLQVNKRHIRQHTRDGTEALREEALYGVSLLFRYAAFAAEVTLGRYRPLLLFMLIAFA